VASAYVAPPRFQQVATAGVPPPCSHAVVCAADPSVRDVRGPRAKLACTGEQIGQGDDGGPVVKGSCGFFGYVFKGVYVDKLEAASGAFVVLNF